MNTVFFLKIGMVESYEKACFVALGEKNNLWLFKI
jgi:hypothetical protein